VTPLGVEAVKLEILLTIHSLQPYLRYQGGKSKTAKQIVSMMPPHSTYVEPMVGGGSVFFAKEPAPVEVIADADRDLMTFYTALKQKKTTRCDLTPNRPRLERLVKKREKNKPLNPCEYLYLNKISFGGKGKTWNPTAAQKCRNNLRRCGVSSKDDKKYAERLKGVKIRAGDYAATIKRYDSKDTLHYIDPPYAGTNTGGYKYGRNLTPAEIKKVTDTVKGKVMLSYNNSSQVRKEFCNREAYKKGYRCKKVKTTYTLNNKGKHTPKTELLITKGF